jgi:lipid II:glycine glycyltransferase (peptidoglycan interpeptide bridge formation enzyme)
VCHFRTHFGMARFKKKWGDRYCACVLRNMVQLLVLRKLILYPMNATLSFAYAPYGPLMTSYDPIAYVLLAEYIQDICNDSLAYIRLEIPYEHRREIPAGFHALTTAQIRGSFMQPRVDWELSLAGTDEELFEQFHKQTRKLVRKAQSLNTNIVIVDDALSDSFHIFESMMRETAAAKRIFTARSEVLSRDDADGERAK